MQSFKPYSKRTSLGSAPLRVLMQNRANVFTQRGGDTVLMERLKAGLEALKVEVVFDLDGTANLADFDIVHLFNFALPDMVRYFGECAERAGKPFVVSTLAEDIPHFHNQSVAFAARLMEYVSRGQSSEWWQENLPQNIPVANAQRFENAWAADHATALFSNGPGETKVLRHACVRCVYLCDVCMALRPLVKSLSMPSSSRCVYDLIVM